MTEIPVPKVNNNDSVYVLLAWTVKDGQTVRAGDVIAELETSKTVEELTAPQDGPLWPLLPEGAECAPGQIIARIGGEPGRSPDPAAPCGAAEAADASLVTITEPARRFMAEHGISIEQVGGLGVKVVRRADLEALARRAPVETAETAETAGASESGEAAGGGLIELSRIQRRVAETVERSHREIPAAFTAMRVDVTDALRYVREESRRSRTLIGLPELLVKTIGDMLARFPIFFSAPVDGRRARPAAVADVGVTMDMGTGMVVPVVRDAGGRALADIAADLMRLRRIALSGRFREEDLHGAAIMLTLHTENGVTTATPMIFPGQMCALSLTAPRVEVVHTAKEGFTTRKAVSLGLSYDHRFVNGRQAAEFLGALRTVLETPRRPTLDGRGDGER